MEDAINEARFHNWIAQLPLKASWESLSELQRTILLVYKLELEVSNGGIEQFFVNPAGDKWRETVAALERIGAMRIKHIFESALALFPESSPSTDQTMRSLQLCEAGSKAVETLGRLDDEYFEIHSKFPDEDSYPKMCRYLSVQIGPNRR